MKVLLGVILGVILSFGDVFAQSPSAFQSMELSDEVFARIEGKSFKQECTTPREDLRYLRVLHYNKEGEELEGELVCHKDIADDLLDIFRKLHEARYPIETFMINSDNIADYNNGGWQ